MNTQLDSTPHATAEAPNKGVSCDALLAALRRLEREPLVTIRIAGYRKSKGPKLELLVWEKASGLSSACGVKYRKIVEDECDPAEEIVAAASFLANKADMPSGRE